MTLFRLSNGRTAKRAAMRSVWDSLRVVRTIVGVVLISNSLVGLAVQPQPQPRPAGGDDLLPRDTEVVVYAALDREFSEPIFKQFEAETGIRVLASYDVESTKTVGLTERLMREAANPQCDVFWNNEMLHTLRLAREGVLDTYVSPEDKNFPANYRASNGQWHALAARARIIIYNTNRMRQPPRSIYELADPQWKGQAGIAKPLFGTTATHFAVLYEQLGAQKAELFFSAVRDNVKVLSGNKQVAQAVASGQLAWGVTDTDDAMVEMDAGRPVKIVFPDQSEPPDMDAIPIQSLPKGTLFIPNTVCVIKGGPHPEAARRLIDFLLTADVERQLAIGASAQFPLGSLAQDTPSRAAPAEPIVWLEPDFEAAAEKWGAASQYLRDQFATSDSMMLRPEGIAATAVGALLFLGGILGWAPRLIHDRKANRVVFASAGLLLAVAGWWLATR